MTEMLPKLATPSDAELIARVRGGDSAAYGELFDGQVLSMRKLVLGI